MVRTDGQPIDELCDLRLQERRVPWGLASLRPREAHRQRVYPFRNGTLVVEAKAIWRVKMGVGTIL